MLTDVIIAVCTLKCKNNKKERPYYIFYYKFAEKNPTQLKIQTNSPIETEQRQDVNKSGCN